MTLHGPPYPSSTTLEPAPQEFVLNLLCATEVSEPEFKSYDGNRVVVEWSAPPGCSFRSEVPAEEGDKTPEREVEAVGSGIGWFFLLFVFCFASKRDKSLMWTTPRLLIVFASYFALGAYYNYTTYGATGVDLIPCVPSLLITRRLNR
jgi:autophagy-related protein 27